MYKDYAVYRFSDKNKHIIYIGRTKNAYRRLYQEHFKSSEHLSKDCYNSTARIDIIKLLNTL